MLHSSPLHRPPPAAAITTWSELSYALQPGPVSPAHGRARMNSAPSRARQHSLGGGSTARYNPYSTSAAEESPTKAPRKHRSTNMLHMSMPAVTPSYSSPAPAPQSSEPRTPVVTNMDLLVPLREARTEEERDFYRKKLASISLESSTRAIHELGSMSSIGVGEQEKRMPIFPHAIMFDEEPKRSGRGVTANSALDGTGALVGCKDQVLKNWPHDRLLVKMSGEEAGQMWEAEIGTLGGQVTRKQLLKELAKAMMN